MKKIIFIFAIVSLLASCLEVEQASIIPEIKFKEFIYFKGIKPDLEDTAMVMNLTLSFIDGDADVGSIDSTDMQLFIIPYKKKNKVLADTLDTLKYMIPYIKPIKSVRTMNGEIFCQFYVQKLGEYQINDTFVYESYILDREEHKSNIITTPDFIFRY